MDIVWYGVQYLLFEVLYLYVPRFGGLNHDEIMVFLGTMFVIDALNMMLTSSNFWAFPEMVRSGELDFFLLKPVSPAFLSMFRYPSVGSLFNFFVALSFLIYAMSGVPLMDRMPGLLLYPLYIGLGLGTMVAMQYIFMAISIYTIGADGIQWILFNLHTLGARPDSMYTGIFRKILLTAVPMAMLASVPTRLLLPNPDYTLIGISGACAVAYMFISLRVFYRALSRYSGASA